MNRFPFEDSGGFGKGDRVRICEGSFEHFEGVVDEVRPAEGVVVVLLRIFGKDTPVTVESWQLEKA